MQTYTKLTCEIKGPNGDCDIRTTSIVFPGCDLEMDYLFEMMRNLAMAMGYHPDTVKEYFEPEDVEYETTKEIKDESY